MEEQKARPKRYLTRERTLRARELRANASVVERIMREKLRKYRVGFRFRFQHVFRNYVLDFYCPEAQLAIEFDGEQHDLVADARRDQMLRDLGIETLRIPNREFFMLNPEAAYTDWIEKIIVACESRTGRKVPR